ncbi:hypothetical protein [Streptomyces sp. NPDC006477]|uniref:zinc finger Ran-binding domain-containing protein n=1 Tax=Streptomyces sp. NPDC006477 TaxID=3364747 RepID=UPI00368ED75F
MAGSAKWKCKDCGSNTAAGAAPCGICGSTRKDPIAAAPAPSRPAAKRPSPARPSGDWLCTVCRATNPSRRLDCVGCGKSWRTSGGPASKKTTPKPTTAKPTTAKPATPKPATTKATPSKATPPRPGTTRKTAPKRPTPKRPVPPRTGTTGGTGAGATGLLYPPPSSTGYTPAPPRTTPPPRRTPPTYTPPVYTPPYRPPAKKKSNGCMVGCLSVVGGLVLLGILNGGITAIVSSLDEADPTPTTSTGPTAAACPSRVASTLPSGEGATLVEAFRTDDHRITLCRTTAGKLYYFGEFRDGREKGISMPAKKTSDGYEARNSPYRYVIDGGTVSVYKSGSRIAHEELTPEPSPS